MFSSKESAGIPLSTAIRTDSSSIFLRVLGIVLVLGSLFLLILPHKARKILRKRWITATAPGFRCTVPEWKHYTSADISPISDFRSYFRSNFKSNAIPNLTQLNTIDNESTRCVPASVSTDALSATNRVLSSASIDLQHTDNPLPPKILDKEDKNECLSPLERWANTFDSHELIALGFKRTADTPFHKSYKLNSAGASRTRMHGTVDQMHPIPLWLRTRTSIRPIELSLPTTRETSCFGSEEIESYLTIDNPERPIYIRQLELLLMDLIGAIRQRLINLLMDQFGMRRGEVHCGRSMVDAGEQGTTPKSQYESGATLSTSKSDLVTPKRKGRAYKGGGDDEDANENRPRKIRPNQDISEPIHRRFACPYYKRDSSGFQKRTGFSPCAGPGWNDMAKLKEHLYRCHHRLLQCQRCKLPFDTQAALDTHAESTLFCQPRARQLQDGFTIGIFFVMKRKKKSFPGQTEEDKWKEIFQLLFPDIEVPSPYYSNEYEHNIESGNTLSTSPLEQYGQPLSNELRSHPMALVADAMRSLETQLSNHVSTLMEDSRRAISVENLPINLQRLGNYGMTGLSPNLSNSLLSSSQSLAFSQDVEPSLEMTAAGSRGEHNTFPQIDFDFDSFLEPDCMPNEPPQRSIGTTSSDSGFASNPFCPCNGICHCQDSFPHRLPAAVSSTPSHGIASFTNENILNLLQNLSRDVSELKQNLNSKK